MITFILGLITFGIGLLIKQFLSLFLKGGVSSDFNDSTFLRQVRTSLGKSRSNGYSIRTRSLIRWLDALFLYPKPKKGSTILHFLGLKPFLLFQGLALCYPILIFSVVWAFTGNSNLGDFSLFIDETSNFERLVLAISFWLSILIWAYLLSGNRNYGSPSKTCLLITAGVLGFLSTILVETAGLQAIIGGAIGTTIVVACYKGNHVTVAYLMVFIAGVAASTSGRIPQIGSAALLFLALPLSNAIVDWLSVGATRYFLRVILTNRSALLTLLIAALEIIVSCLSVLACIFTLHYSFSTLLDTSNPQWTAFIEDNRLAIVLVSFTAFIPSLFHIFAIAIALSERMAIFLIRLSVDSLDAIDTQQEWFRIAYSIQLTSATIFILCYLASIILFLNLAINGTFDSVVLDLFEFIERISNLM